MSVRLVRGTGAQRGTGDPSVARRTLGALALVEGWRLLRHPATLVGLAGAVWWLAVDGRGALPVLDRADVTTAAAVLPLAGGVFLAANQAALRSRRHGTDELDGTLPAAPAIRTGAHLVALAGVVALAATLAAAKLAWFAATGAVKAPSLAEAAVGPAVVALAGVLGVLVARWAPSLVVGPVVLLALVVLGFLQVGRLTGGDRLPRYLWLRPWHDLRPPREVAYRPAGRLAPAVPGRPVCPARDPRPRPPRPLRQADGRRRPGRRGAGRLGLGAAPARATRDGDRDRADGRAPPGLPGLRAARERSLLLLPWLPALGGALGGGGRAGARPAACPGPLPPGRGPPRRRRAVAARRPLVPRGQALAHRCPLARRRRSGDPRGHGLAARARRRGRCLRPDLADRRLGGRSATRAAGTWRGGRGVRHQRPGARVVAPWLAGQSRPGAPQGLRAIFAAQPSAPEAKRYFVEDVGAGPGVGFAGRIPPPWLYSGTDGSYALELLDRPAEQVAAAIRLRWGRLTDPATPTAELVSALGLRPSPAFSARSGTTGHPDWQPPPCR